MADAKASRLEILVKTLINRSEDENASRIRKLVYNLQPCKFWDGAEVGPIVGFLEGPGFDSQFGQRLGLGLG